MTVAVPIELLTEVLLLTHPDCHEGHKARHARASRVHPQLHRLLTDTPQLAIPRNPWDHNGTADCCCVDCLPF